jgi:hypothetical protein
MTREKCERRIPSSRRMRDVRSRTIEPSGSGLEGNFRAPRCFPERAPPRAQTDRHRGRDSCASQRAISTLESRRDYRGEGGVLNSACF